jgi:hypothetical protein
MAVTDDKPRRHEVDKPAGPFRGLTPSLSSRSRQIGAGDLPGLTIISLPGAERDRTGA